MLPGIKTHQETTSRLPYAAFLLLGSLFLYTIQDSLMRFVPGHYSFFQIIFFRSLFALIPLFFLGIFENKKLKTKGHILKTNYFKGQIIRGVLMFLSLCFYVIACRKLPLASLYTLSYTSPLFMTLLAIPILKEHIGFLRMVATFMGFLGVVFVLEPGMETFQVFGLFAVASGLFTGVSVIMGKRLAFEDSNTLIILYYVLVSLVFSLIALPFVWITPTLFDMGYFVLIGITGGIAQYGFIHAFRLAPVSSLAPFDYMGFLLALIAGYILWGESPKNITYIGAVLVISGGLFTLYREKKIKKLKGPSNPYHH